MDTPPKSDADDASTVAGSEPETGDAKKTPRRRTRYYSKSKAADAAPAESPAPKAEVFVPESKPEPAPAPREESSTPLPAQAEPASHHAPAERSGGAETGQGGDFQGRGFWKHNKQRKRGKHGWQPGGKPGGNYHPPQPPPPSFAPVFGDLPDPARFADIATLDRLADEISSGKGKPLYLDELYALPLAELTAFATDLGATFADVPNRKQLLAKIFSHMAEAKREIRDRGWLDLTDRGFGFLVHERVNYRLYPEDPFVPESLVHHYGLKRGHQMEVIVQAPQGNERCPAVVHIESVMGGKPGDISKVTPFEELVPYYPLKRILLEAEDLHKDVSMRVVDMLTPIGFGQRGLIVAPPRTGKTVLLQNIANSISHNSPETKLILLLIDERPEEVTDFRRHTHGEVVSSTFDEAPESHVHAAEMVGEKARRLVEAGEHVVILLDSITRLARAYNALAANSGKIMSGGIEATALQKPKRFFGAARNIEGGGSLTIIGTALIDTGSRMDEVIFEEFKGTGNMELHLDRGLVDKRIFPAINMDRSGTRKEELI
ncbi:MAG TPA: transcription termination factor Rho, partial [Opitutaceae bacterium]|nr:transcription termination factor Rho [Opitutaceae bacterium]